MSSIRTEQSISDDELEVILPTPERPKKKLKPSRLQKCHGYSPSPDLTPHTAQELWIAQKVHNLSSQNDPLTVSNMRSFIYHNHKDFFSYDNYLPKYNNIKMIGIFKCNAHGYFLKNYSSSDDDIHFYVMLCVKNLQSLPEFGEQIEVYGHIEFDTVNNKKLPVLNVCILKKIPFSLQEYLDYMEMQKLLIPSNYKEKVWNDFDDTTFITPDEITILFNEHCGKTSPNDTYLQSNQPSSKYNNSEVVIRDKDSLQNEKLFNDAHDEVHINSKDKSLIDFVNDTEYSFITNHKSSAKYTQPLKTLNKLNTCVDDIQPSDSDMNKVGDIKSNVVVPQETEFCPNKEGIQDGGCGVHMNEIVDFVELNYIDYIVNTNFEEM